MKGEGQEWKEMPTLASAIQLPDGTGPPTSLTFGPSQPSLQAGCRAKVTKIYLQFVLRLSNLSTREFQFEVVGHQFRVSPTANVLPAVIFDSIRRLFSSSSRRKERVVSPQNLF